MWFVVRLGIAVFGWAEFVRKLPSDGLADGMDAFFVDGGAERGESATSRLLSVETLET